MLVPIEAKGVREGMLLSLELEKSKLNREKSLILLDKSLLVYFAFLVVGIVGFIRGYLDARYLNMVVLLSFGVLAVGIVPYMITMSGEERKLNTLIAACAKGRNGNRKSARSRR